MTDEKKENPPLLSLNERIDFLAALLDRVDGWLRYAERKNGILLTLASATIGLALRINHEESSQIAVGSHWLGTFFCLLSVIVLIISFIPQLNRILAYVQDRLESKKQPQGTSLNFIYFGHISGQPFEDFEHGLSERLGVSNFELSAIERDFIEQIHINSIISYRKFQLFPPSFAFLIIGLTLLVVGLTLK